MQGVLQSVAKGVRCVTWTFPATEEKENEMSKVKVVRFRFGKYGVTVDGVVVAKDLTPSEALAFAAARRVMVRQ